MQKVSQLIINDFKFFYGKTVLDFDRKNILIFGENGSGKSSIYWTLYTFFQSVFKNKKDIQKYFDEDNDENLINRFVQDKKKSSITLEFQEDDKTKITKEISLNTINTISSNDTLIEEATQSSDFINYKLLSKLYDFSNKNTIDLFSIFESEIFRFVFFKEKFQKYNEINNEDKDKTGTSNALDWWNYLKQGINIKPKPRRDSNIHEIFDESINEFNRELEYYLIEITKSSNDFLQKKFNQPLEIKFSYEKCTYDDFIEGSTTQRNHKTILPKIILEVNYINDKLNEDTSSIKRPQSFLNEAKLTTIALSIRFSILKEKLTDNATKILVLDDLLLSLDMSNRDMILEIILSEFNKFQMIILTHDKLFFEMTKHKIKQNVKDNDKENKNNSEWKYFEMYETIKDGIPQPFITNSETYIEKAERFFMQKEYEASGNFLRKEVESFCEDFLPKKYHYNSDYSLHNLSGLLTECIKFASENGLDKKLFEELDSYRKFILNSTSHDSYDVPKFGNEISKCIETLKKIRKIKFNSPFKKKDKLEFELINNKNDTYKFEITIQDDFRLIKDLENNYFLTKGLINYKVLTNGISKSKGLEHSTESIQKMYEKNYEKSNKTKSSDFWEEVIFSDSKEKLSKLKNDNKV